MPLVYLPDAESLFLWGTESAPRAPLSLGQGGETWSATLVAPEGLRDTSGVRLPLFDTMARLAVVPAADLESLPASVATWVLASKLAMDLVARERVVPTISRRGGRIEARWAAALAGSEDAAKVAAIAASMPPAAHAVPAAGDRSGAVWAPDALVRAYLDATVDALVRTARGGPSLGGSRASGRASTEAARSRTARAAPSDTWATRWRTALADDQRSFETDGFAERSVVDELARWSEPALGARDRLRACFRLELPADDGEPFVLRFLLQSPDDPSLLVPVGKLKASEYDKPRAPLPTLHFSFDEPVTHGAVLRQLGAPPAWEGDASPADILAPLVRAAAESARQIAMAEPSDGDEQLAQPTPTPGHGRGKGAAKRRGVQ